MDIGLWHLALLWIVGYSLVSLVASRTNRVPSFLTAQGPLTLIHTTKGLDFIDRLAKRYPRFWAVWGVAGVALFFVGLALGTVLILVSAVRIVNQPSSAPLAKDPQNMLVIPGVNDYLPLSATPELVTALLIAMVVHELGHAIYCRLGDIDIKSTGLVLFALLPAGAFVEPDEDSQADAPRAARIKMVSAGVMNNLGLVVIGMALLVLVVPMLVTPAPGVAIGGVLPGSPADDAGLSSGDRIVAVDGTAVHDTPEFQAALKASDTADVRVETADGTTRTLNRHLFVLGAYQSASIAPNDVITHVDGTPVATGTQFASAIRQSDDETLDLTFEDGRTVPHLAGARVHVGANSSLSQFATDEGALVITAIDGTRIYDAASLSEVMGEISAGDTVAVHGGYLRADGVQQFETEYTVPPTGAEFIATNGVGGISVGEVGIESFPAEQYLGYLTAESVSVWEALVLIIFLPFATIGGLPYNFAGFTPDIMGFYQVAEPLSAIAPVVFFLVSLTFWTVWINANLALFNCLPTFALDGGHYTKYGLESIAARLGSPYPKQASKWYARALAAVMLVGIGLVMVIPALLG